MTPNQIESWALRVADDIVCGRPVEDLRVEVKLRWPIDFNKAARRIAGQSNAAHGGPILWIIGIDEEKKEVLGADRQEMADWLPRIQAEFCELAPTVTHLNVVFNGTTIVALVFDTDRAPFLVKNPAFGKSETPVSFEVPWREGTKVRTATRADLFRMLTPLESLPSVDPISMSLLAKEAGHNSLHWIVKVVMYISSRVRSEMIFPFHLCSASIDFGDHSRRILFTGQLMEQYPEPQDNKRTTIRGTSTEIIIPSAGMVIFKAYAETTLNEVQDDGENIAQIGVNLVQTHDDRPIFISGSVNPNSAMRGIGNWQTWGESIR